MSDEKNKPIDQVKNTKKDEPELSESELTDVAGGARANFIRSEFVG